MVTILGVTFTLFKMKYFYLINKTFVPVFYCGNKIWVRVRVRMN